MENLILFKLDIGVSEDFSNLFFLSLYLGFGKIEASLYTAM